MHEANALRRPAAVLVAAAVAGERGISRDKLLGLLWPETDSDRARHSLTQAIYTARRATGIDDLFLTSGSLRLNRDRVSSDIDDFERALDARDLESAVALYDGPFLDGFFLSGSAEFEQWISAQRMRLENLAVSALEELATRASSAGDHWRAIEWRRRLVALRPLDSRAAAAPGDRARARRRSRGGNEARAGARRRSPGAAFARAGSSVRDDGLAAARAAVAWRSGGAVARHGGRTVRGRRARDSSRRRPRVRSRTVAGSREVRPFENSQENSQNISRTGASPADRRRGGDRHCGSRHRVVRHGNWLVDHRIAGGRSMAPLFVAPSTCPARVRPWRISGAAPPSCSGISSKTIRPCGRSTTGWSRRCGAAPATIASTKFRATLLRLANAEGAARIIVGSIVGSPARAVLSASMLAGDGAVLGRAVVEGPADSVSQLTAELAARLIEAEAGEDAVIPARQTVPLPALRAFLNGRRAYRKAEYAVAADDFEVAVRVDSTFAAASLQLARAADRTGDLEREDAALARAWPYRTTLADHDRAQLIALAARTSHCPPIERPSLRPGPAWRDPRHTERAVGTSWARDWPTTAGDSAPRIPPIRR